MEKSTSPPAIQANSLSEITALAENPPTYPRYADSKSREPLVLYISRVPGNVILSTIKPRAKVVTVEDINSSLFYLHVEKEDEEPSVPELQNFQDFSISQKPARETTPVLRRKPINISPRQSLESPVDHPAGKLEELGHPPYKNGSSPRYEGHPAFKGDQPVRRKPLGPRPVDSTSAYSLGTLDDSPRLDLTFDDFNSLNVVPNGSRAPLRPTIDTRPRPKSFQDGQLLDPLSCERHHARRRSNNSLSSSPEATTPIHQSYITLIRRNPASGAQWNVGKIKTRSPRAPSPRRTSQPLDPTSSTIDIEISTPGYLRFCSTPPFRRSITRNTRRLSTGDTSTVPTGGFSFTSVWDGDCQLSTGLGGRNLKCNHTVSVGERTAKSAPISDLRFNLPVLSSSSSSAPSSPAKASERAAGNKRSSIFHRRRTSRANSYEDGAWSAERGFGADIAAERSSGETEPVAEPERMDLSLGQERAGGGFSGKKAKLGKLVVEDEGLKMLDLCVAANMGVWWQVYDRGE